MFFSGLTQGVCTVNHGILLKKLWHYGFRGVSHDYLKSYFSDRKQYVHQNGLSSNMMHITAGVPQGSILGSICFSLLINDLPLYVEAFTVLFVDDDAFAATSATLSVCIIKLRSFFTTWRDI